MRLVHRRNFLQNVFLRSSSSLLQSSLMLNLINQLLAPKMYCKCICSIERIFSPSFKLDLLPSMSTFTINHLLKSEVVSGRFSAFKISNIGINDHSALIMGCPDSSFPSIQIKSIGISLAAKQLIWSVALKGLFPN